MTKYFDTTQITHISYHRVFIAHTILNIIDIECEGNIKKWYTLSHCTNDILAWIEDMIEMPIEEFSSGSFYYL